MEAGEKKQRDLLRRRWIGFQAKWLRRPLVEPA
jgi:hypothetical protein